MNGVLRIWLVALLLASSLALTTSSSCVQADDKPITTTTKTTTSETKTTSSGVAGKKSAGESKTPTTATTKANPVGVSAATAKPGENKPANAAKAAGATSKTTESPKSAGSKPIGAGATPGTAKVGAGKSTTGKKSVRATKRPAHRTAAASNAKKTPLPAVHPATGENVWNSVSEGFSLAKKTKKMIIADFYTDWCGWCKVMDKQTFVDPTVQKMFRSFVLVRANAEDNGEGQRLATQLGLQGFPSTVVFEASGKPKGVIVGFKPAEEFRTAVADIVAGKTALQAQ